MSSVIFFDIDGTLITEDERAIIPESAKEAIAETRRRGNVAVINSGRTAFNIPENVKDLGFDGYICGCGTYIEYGGDVLLHNILERDFCREIADISRKYKVTPVYEWSEAYYFDKTAPFAEGLDYFMKVFVKNGIDISKRVEDEDFIFDKFVVWKNRFSDMEGFFSEIGKYFNIIDRGDGFYENVPIGFSKSTGIDFLMNDLGLPLNDAYAIGDSMNDLPMLEAVPNSIAMGGSQEIYPYVSYITSSIENDGIAMALKHYGLI